MKCSTQKTNDCERPRLREYKSPTQIRRKYFFIRQGQKRRNHRFGSIVNSITDGPVHHQKTENGGTLCWCCVDFLKIESFPLQGWAGSFFLLSQPRLCTGWRQADGCFPNITLYCARYFCKYVTSLIVTTPLPSVSAAAFCAPLNSTICARYF